MPQYSYLLCFVLFLMWAIFKDFLEFDTVLLRFMFSFLAAKAGGILATDHGSAHCGRWSQLWNHQQGLSPVRPGLAPLWRFSLDISDAQYHSVMSCSNVTLFCEVVLTKTSFKYLPMSLSFPQPATLQDRVATIYMTVSPIQLMTYSPLGGGLLADLRVCSARWLLAYTHVWKI